MSMITFMLVINISSINLETTWIQLGDYHFQANLMMVMSFQWIQLGHCGFEKIVKDVRWIISFQWIQFGDCDPEEIVKNVRWIMRILSVV